MISLQKIGNELNSELLEFDGLSTEDKPINIYRPAGSTNGNNQVNEKKQEYDKNRTQSID